MLEAAQVYVHPDGRTVTLGSQMDVSQAVGEVFMATLTFGPLSVGVVATADGLSEAGYQLQEPEPQPEHQPQEIEALPELEEIEHKLDPIV